MKAPPDIGTVLNAGEQLLWQGAPGPGRRAARRAVWTAAGLVLLALCAAALAVWFEVVRGRSAGFHLSAIGLLTLAALLTYAALKLVWLDPRRARARDARARFAITDRRAFSIVGPYVSEIALRPGVSSQLRADGLIVVDGTAQLRFERLDDAAKARDILTRAVEGTT